MEEEEKEEGEAQGKGKVKKLAVGCSNREEKEKNGCVGGDWVNVPCESECVLDVTLERISLRGKVKITLFLVNF